MVPARRYSFLIGRADQSLQNSRSGYDLFVREGHCEDRKNGPGGGPSRGGDAGDFVQVRSPSGGIACSSQVTGFEATASPPRLPAVIAAPAGNDPAAARYFTVPSEDGKSRYRVRVSTEPHSGATVVVASSLADVDATLRRLLLIELLVTGAVRPASPRSGSGSSSSGCGRSVRSERQQTRSPRAT